MLIRIFLFILLIPSFLLGVCSCGPPEKEKAKAKTNSPPVITSVNILPEKPSRENDLGVSVQGHDPDQDPITYFYQWSKNGVEIAGENRNVLKSGTFNKGDLIAVKVVPSDGKEEGKPFLSSPVKILNSPPVLQEVKIEPPTGSAREDLKVVLKGIDPDGDFIYYSYRWEKNGVALNEEGKETLEPNRFKKGDSITVTVTPDDREATGISKKSDRVIISNSPPLIVSSPPVSIEGPEYLYQIEANDPDHDPITFVIKSGPKGMKIDQHSGILRWGVRPEDKGNHAIEIEASDNEGAKSIQRYLLTVDFRPS
jgi:hypothetical protein